MAPQIGTVQKHLERIYAIDPGCRAEQHLVASGHAPDGDPGTPGWRPEEQLLVREAGTEMELGLYLAPGLLERLRSDDPLHRLHDGNLADLCLLIEGVSHFLGVAWHAVLQRPVTCLELELQAEIDKYVLVLLLATRQGRGRLPHGLHRRLFRQARLAPHLPHHERQRYHRASRYAAHYCNHLARHMNAGGPRDLVRELRRFYRMQLRGKLGRIRAQGLVH
ncbi:MAG: hypothetical protein R3298_09160 [Gammaproteobacteria bacterium]|nr:hypothetical protein [Gammaproteobacteria bacterium]